MRLWPLIIIAITAMPLSAPCLAQFQTTDLGSILSVTQAPSISPDGSVVVSVRINSDGRAEAASWENGQISGLGSLDPNHATSGALASSSHGDVIAGFSVNASGFIEAFRWSDGHMVGLGFLSDNPVGDSSYVSPFSFASDVSSDGSVTVGVSLNADGQYEAVRWLDGSMLALGSLTGPNTIDSWATSVSADGKVIVGRSNYQAFRWVDGVMTSLLDSSQYQQSAALAVSADGSVVVGWTRTSNDFEAFRWESGQTMALGFLDPDAPNRFSTALAVSGDGRIVVGASTATTGADGAFLWTQSKGMQDLAAAALSAGVDTGSYILQAATGISENGEIIVGYGFDPNGQGTVWILRLENNDSPVEPGLITPAEAARSFAEIGWTIEGATSWLDQGASIFGEASRNQHCDHSARSLCGFAFIDGRTPWGHDDAYLNGTFGVNAFLGSAIYAGVGVRGGSISSEKTATNGQFDVLSAAAYLALAPETGLRISAAGQFAHLEAEMERWYANGANASISQGATSGNAFSSAVRVGWSFAPIAGVFFEPFAEHRFAHLSVEGWTESGGSFPGIISGIDRDENRLRTGIESRFNSVGPLDAWFSLAWVHRFEPRSVVVVGNLIDLFSVASPTAALDQDWFELTTGLKLPLDGGAVVSASVTLQGFAQDDPGIGGKLGFSQAF